MLWRFLKWIGAACLAVLAVWAVRKGYQASLPTVEDLELGRDMHNAALQVARRRGIADDALVAVKNPRTGHTIVADQTIDVELAKARLREDAQAA